MFESLDKLVLGFLTGVIFGFLLQKGRVAKFEVIVGQFLLRDWTVVKTMGTAVVVGAIGVYALVAADAASLHIKPALLGGVLAAPFGALVLKFVRPELLMGAVGCLIIGLSFVQLYNALV